MALNLHLLNLRGDSMKKAIKDAFPHTLPVLTGYLFICFAYGLLMSAEGFSVFTTMIFSIFGYSGTCQFAAVPYLKENIDIISFSIMIMILNSRHIFYGIALLGKYRDVGSYKPLLIYTLSDETFSLVYSKTPSPGIKKRDFFLAISLLDYIYWQLGTLIGAVTGQIIKFDTKGIEFVLTALFLLIFTDQLEKKSTRSSSLIGFVSSVICLIIFGKDNFMLPAMIVIFLVLTLIRFWRYEWKKIHY